MATSAEYKQYLQSPQWQAKRRKILHRAGYRCELCRKAKPLQVHHLTYERKFRERLGDLQAVCDRCHRRIHGIKPWWVKGLKILWHGIRRMV
jgi:5-methylcytosine-specific restriction endonuclease McrA